MRECSLCESRTSCDSRHIRGQQALTTGCILGEHAPLGKLLCVKVLRHGQVAQGAVGLVGGPRRRGCQGYGAQQGGNSRGQCEPACSHSAAGVLMHPIALAALAPVGANKTYGTLANMAMRQYLNAEEATYAGTLTEWPFRYRCPLPWTL